MFDITQMLSDAKQWQDKMVPTAKSGGSWYEVTNAVDGRASVRIYDEIGGWGVRAEELCNDLDKITASEIEVAINSPGGSVFEGLAIYNALRVHPARIVTRVDGLAASAASFIAQAGDERVMVESSQMMIHDARAVVAGDAETMRHAADFLEKQSANIAALYSSRSGMHDTEHYASLMSVETWMSADEAVENGLADSVLVPDRQPSPNNSSNTSPLDAIRKPAAMAAGSPDASLVESQAGERARVLRSFHLTRNENTNVHH